MMRCWPLLKRFSVAEPVGKTFKPNCSRLIRRQRPNALAKPEDP